MMDNPFSVKSPEGLDPGTIASLFVDVYTDFPKLQEVGHTFLHGARGTGKSMMLRFLEPSVQLAAGKATSAKDLRFYAVHVPIKRANLSITEMERMDGVAKTLLSEHMLCVHVASRILHSLSETFGKDASGDSVVRRFFGKDFLPLYEGAGGIIDDAFMNSLQDAKDPFLVARERMDREFILSIQYLKRNAFQSERSQYEGALAGYLDFLYPLIERVKDLPFMPNGPVFLMLDDADNLPIHMQRIVNSWVATRTQDVISLKISTQLNYQTWRTPDGTVIFAPHDFTEIDIGTIYSSHTDHYYQRVQAIAKKRIALLHPMEDIDPEKFFPVNAKQEEAIEKIKRSLREKHKKGEGRGHRASDDVVRYAIPEYMASLAGTKKSSGTYSYAGFRNLVFLSSGVVRWFLDAAALMFNEMVSKRGIEASQIREIPPEVQNRVIYTWSEDFLVAELEKLRDDDPRSTQADGRSRKNVADMLGVLINSLGEGFRHRLLDRNASERKLFSIVVTGQIPEDVQKVLSLGVRWGYLQKSTIGSKEGRGRRPQYILSRRLAPYFRLDPTGYAGYLSLDAETLELACHDTRKYLKKRFANVDSSKEQQGQLPFGG